MGEVARIEVPLPSPLTATTDGFVADGQAYSVKMPSVASDAMVVTSQGKAFSNKPTELVFSGLDADGVRRWDYIVGSAPSSVTTRDYEARYKRLYPNTDDVLIPKEESVKHLTILNERVRMPAEYLVSDVEFGVSSIVTGVTLPSGYHDTITVDGFTLPQPVAHDAELRECVGRYEVVDGDGEQTLYVWFDATWVANATYPVTIDPTVATSTTNSQATAFQNQCKIRRFSNGVLLTAFVDSTTLNFRYSGDNGQTWSSPSAGGTMTVTSGATCSIYIDPDDYVHLVVAVPATGCGYIRGTPDTARTGYTWSSAIYDDGGNVNYNYVPDVVAHREGTGWCAHMVYGYANSSGSTFFVRCVRFDIASNATITKATSTTLWSYLSGGGASIEYPCIAIDGSKNLYVSWKTGMTGTGYGVRFKKGTYSAGPTWTWGTDEAVTEATNSYQGAPIGLDSQGRAYIAFQDATGSNLRMFRRAATGGFTDLTPSPNRSIGGHTMVIDDSDNVYVFYNVTTTGLYYSRFNGSTWDAQATADGTANAGSYPSARGDVSGYAIDVVYGAGASSPYSIKSYRLTLNVAPSAPTITLASSTFAAATGTNVTITHNDTDQMSAWAWKYVLGSVTKWWNNTTKAFDQSAEYWNTGSGFSVTIAAADLANKLTTGNVYQFFAATKDSLGAVGDYNSVAALANVGATPNVTITSATTTRSANYTIQWTVDQIQGAYQVRLLDGATVLLTTGKVSDASARAYTVNMPTNAKTYTVEVTCWDATAGGGVASTPVTKNVTTSFTPVATPTMSVNPLSDGGYIGVTWTSSTPTGGQPNCAYVDLYRNGVRIATQLPASGSYPDFNVASGVSYTYFVRAVGDNATTADSTTGSGSITFTTGGLWLHAVTDPQGTAHLFVYREQLKDERTHASADFSFAGRKLPVTQFDALMGTRPITVRIAIPDDSDDRDALETLFDLRTTLCMRDYRGRKVFVTLKSLPLSDEKWGGWCDISFTGVDFVEEV